MAYNDIIKALSVVTRRATVNVTIPEGTTAVGVAQIFVDAGLVDNVDTFLSCANGNDGTDLSKYDFWNAIPDNDRLMKCEGYLFPDTYNLYKDESVAYYVDTLYGEFASKTAALADTVAAKGTSLDDVVKLASFIQEEAGLESEDAKVSACFHNRLESDDPQWAEHKLESNASSYIMQDSENNYLWNSPTAEYFGWPEQGAIPDDVLALYDTYAISGLPAGPISSRYAAIEAALNPDQEYIDEGYYFFVTGHPGTDVAGQYFYAKTADEHYQNCVKAGWAPPWPSSGPSPSQREARAFANDTNPQAPASYRALFTQNGGNHYAATAGTAGPRGQPGNAEIRRHVRRGCRLLRPAGIWHARRTRQPDRGRTARGLHLCPCPRQKGLSDTEHPAHQRGAFQAAPVYPGRRRGGRGCVYHCRPGCAGAGQKIRPAGGAHVFHPGRHHQL